jgi:hypothetical protein
MTDVTRILNAIERGDAKATDELPPLVYEELRLLAAQKLSHEAPGQTLQATALVHEAYLRLVGDEPCGWENRSHFFAAAAEAMRRILIDNARRKRRTKHGGEAQRIDIDQVDVPVAAAVVCLGLQPGELPASPSPSSYREALVAHDATGEARQDWREGGQPFPLRGVPDGRSGCAEDTLS